jgi:hypothetical protein
MVLWYVCSLKFISLRYTCDTPASMVHLLPVHLNLSDWLISHDIVFFFHNKSANSTVGVMIPGYLKATIS